MYRITGFSIGNCVQLSNVSLLLLCMVLLTVDVGAECLTTADVCAESLETAGLCVFLRGLCRIVCLLHWMAVLHNCTKCSIQIAAFVIMSD